MRVERERVTSNTYGSKFPESIARHNEWWRLGLFDDDDVEVGFAEAAIGYFVDPTSGERTGSIFSVEWIYVDPSVRGQRRPVSLLLAEIFDFTLELILESRVEALRFEPYNRSVARFVRRRMGGRRVGYPPYEYVVVDKVQLLATYHDLGT